MTLEEYIRTAAAQRGINPDVAVKVAMSEGGLKDPIRQSGVMRNGVREPSYGPFQLLVGGGETGFPEGLGNRALAAGIDPRNPADAYRGIDFALDEASKKGWGQWYGAKAAGLDNFAGIGGRPAATATVMDGPKGQETIRPVIGSMAPSAIASSAAPATPSSAPIPEAVQSLAGITPRKDGLANVFGMMAMADNKPQFSPVQIQGPSPQQANALSSLIQALRQRVV